MDLTPLFPFDWAEITSTEPAGGVKLAVVSVVPAFLTTTGVEASSASPAAAAACGGPATSPTNASAALTTNEKRTRACDFIGSPKSPARWRPKRSRPAIGEYHHDAVGAAGSDGPGAVRPAPGPRAGAPPWGVCGGCAGAGTRPATPPWLAPSCWLPRRKPTSATARPHATIHGLEHHDLPHGGSRAGGGRQPAKRDSRERQEPRGTGDRAQPHSGGTTDGPPTSSADHRRLASGQFHPIDPRRRES